MKKSTLQRTLFALLSLFATSALIVSCSQQHKWNHQERESLREFLDEGYREMLYLNRLSDAEFLVLSDQIIVAVEDQYPLYDEFVAIEDISDTLNIFVVASIVEQVKANAHNMQHIYPYPELVLAEVLPTGLSYSQQSSFYSCMATKINNKFGSLDTFVPLLMSGSVNSAAIKEMQRECASDLFNWSITEVDDLDLVE